MTYIDAFEKIKNKFKDADTKNINEDFALQINFTDEDCHGAFYIEFKDGSLAVEPYDYHDRDALISASFKTLSDIIDKKTDAAKAYEEHLLYIDGNIEKALLITKIEKKAPAKKPAAKKAAPKAEAAKKTAAAKKPAETAKKSKKESKAKK